MGISCSSLNSFTPTPSYLAAPDGSPMSMTLHLPQQKRIPFSSGNDIPPSKSSLFRRRRRKRAHPIATLSPQPGEANLPRARPQDPHRGTTTCTPSPLRGVVPTSPSRLQPSAGPTPPHQYRSRGRGSSGHTRSRSVGAQAHRRSPPPSPHRITRVASTSSLDGRRPPRPNAEPVPSQDDLRPTPWTRTNQIQGSANSSDGRQPLESTLQSILPDDLRYSVGHCPILITNTILHRFSILVLGEVCDNGCLTSLR